MRPATLGIPENRDPGLIRGTQDPGPSTWDRGPGTLYLGTGTQYLYVERGTILNNPYINTTFS